jgi:hypothetical protein
MAEVGGTCGRDGDIDISPRGEVLVCVAGIWSAPSSPPPDFVPPDRPLPDPAPRHE